jgi:hypothetical protein
MFLSDFKSMHSNEPQDERCERYDERCDKYAED